MSRAQGWLVLSIVGFFGLGFPDSSRAMSPGANATVEAPRPLDDDEYQPIVPPDSLAGFFQEARNSANYLSNLPVDRDLGIDLLEKFLNALVINLGDEIHQILQAFGIDIDFDFSRLTFRFLLDLLHFYSYDQNQANKLLEEWEQQGTREEGDPGQVRLELAQRFYLAQKVLQVSFDSGMRLTDDAAVSLFDLIDLILSSNKVIDSLARELGDNPLIGRIVRLIKIKITQRIVWAFQNGVLLVTSYLKEPRRSQVRALATALATTYIKWKDLQLDDSFGGISAEVVTKVGMSIMGKTVLLIAPKIGHVSRTAALAEEGVARARSGQVTGDWDQARLKVLDDEVDTTDEGVLEYVMKTTIKTLALSRTERRAANVAGAISQILQLINILDPSSITRIVSISFRVLAGSLQAHALYNSMSKFFKLKGHMARGVFFSFHPDQIAANTEAAEKRVDTNQREVRRLRTEMRRAKAQFSAAVEVLSSWTTKESADYNSDEFLAAVEELDVQSVAYSSSLTALNGYHRQVVSVSEGREDLVDPLSLSLIDHNMAMAATFASILEWADAAGDHKRRGAVQRKFLDTLARAEESVVTGVEKGHQILESPTRDGGASLELEAPGSIQLDSSMKIKAKLLNTGSEPATNVVLKINLPLGFRATSSSQITIPVINPGETHTVQWQLVGSLADFKNGSIAIIAQDPTGLWASSFVYLSW